MSASRLNPELLRNLRIQLRPRRMIAAASICAAISISVIAYHLYDHRAESAGPDLLKTILLLQFLALLIGGGIYCIQSVHTEKDQNTFDYQRLTPVSPLRLALGKLFGAPALAYFAVLCFMPAALVGAYVAGVAVAPFLECYLILFLGCITFHSLALLTSLFLVRGSSAGGIVLYLCLAWAASLDIMAQGGPLTIQTPGPSFSFWLLDTYSWADRNAPLGPLRDLFFGASVPHVWVLVVLYLAFTAWFLLALARNLKRDPSAYEIFSPAQGFAFAMFLSFLLLGFFRWEPPGYGFFIDGARAMPPPTPANEVEATFLGFSLPIFAVLGLSLLRNRESVRRRTHALGARATDWLAALWPTPPLLAGILIIGFALLDVIRLKLPGPSDWSPGTGLFVVTIFALWLSRDVLYLQWMNLRRTRHPLVMGVLFMVVYYCCTGALMAAFNLNTIKYALCAAALIPATALNLKHSEWVSHRGALLAAAILIAAQAFLFGFLQRRELQKLAAASAVGSEGQTSSSS